jgi:hypothetical protein
MKERILVIFIAVAIGLIITTLVYFLYQQTRSIPQKAPSSSSLGSSSTIPTPTDAPGYLVISSPSENSLTEKRLIEVSGTTHPQDTIIVSSNQQDLVAKPTGDGKFSVDLTIDSGANIILVRSIAPDGSEHKDSRIVTFSTEDF